MFDEHRIAEIAIQGKSESWPYPKIFHDLKESGVRTQEVQVATFQSIYKGDDQEWTEPLPHGFHPLEISDIFNEAALQEALKRRQNHERTYVEFLGDIAAAGVDSYKADMPQQTVTFYGKDQTNFYVLQIPIL